MIEISNLTKHMGNNTVVSDFSFSAGQQECLGLFGQDHTAKTVLLDVIAGSTQPSSGHINIQGFNTQTHPLEARQLVGYQLSNDLGHPTMSVKAFLDFIAAIRGFRGTEKRDRLEQSVARLELFPVLDAPLDLLSIAWKRKVAIAQAILHGPALLLLDEPTEGLAQDQKHAFKALIQSLTQEMTVIIASRHCEELSELCTRALVIANGRLVADTPLPDLQRDSRHFQAVTLTAETPLDLLALAVLPGVAGIEEHRNAPGTVTVLAMPGHTIYPHINTLIASRRWKITSLNLEPGRLNDVVHHLTKEASH
ncbi:MULTISPECIES: ATP-binding cassette domain-containing protein [unclassified Pseudomonas]|jgi:ABC-2 type transport system ATP-binding protein|uniref:ATP-binding cassette domain-containing protein n=1 Tax=unclassified Pseudomonas TaxID=196821 RepID=UPI0008CEE14E|nr:MULTISPECIES: ABC transporter ATP-binding protein [unclassified Pseudomonas]PMV18454.1 ABC transporter ATP-binding protein [Pseudomonas sp. FW305-3-2-15-C-TSA2]PMV20844.1 ABC transporter ATP-binding protein [Pseudomonas sp. DP16D-L5]PMV34037.1 ABC transporter ATP-binding protein [Pseudomonas sp. FW305-3-2-15-A-LB2]PMV39479.1 ABC transporter ATP-binding protein [Pseudomonas sp. FW305-3-2-15-C-R2A1]PMV43909.1 ABC transporter ATP-binding protein [Pseudomonas sp. FW305-3-2-15-C-LB1]